MNTLIAVLLFVTLNPFGHELPMSKAHPCTLKGDGAQIVESGNCGTDDGSNTDELDDEGAD